MKSIDEEEARRKSFMSGFEEAARQFAIDAENYGRLGADMFTSAIGNMNSAIDNFARTGEFSFKQFARSVVQDIMAMILKFQAMQLVMMAMRSMGFGGFSAPFFSAGSGGASFAAAGGEIDGPTIVGENGPELFIPQRRGTVIPNMQATSMGGGQTINYNGPYIQSMNAIDTQSATQFLSRNKQAVWSANQSAQRSLPMSK
jgi:lambda family phage tail tape measure protein